jgi:hypothetical protein
VRRPNVICVQTAEREVGCKETPAKCHVVSFAHQCKDGKKSIKGEEERTEQEFPLK